MIQHIVLIKWKPTTTEADIVAAFEAARALLDDIHSVQKLTLGRNRAESDHGYTHALIVNLADGEALRSYLDDPTRMRYVREQLQPLEEERIEIDVPAVDMTLRRDPTVRDWEWGASVGMGPPLDD
jgi:Stress responsive A/B Barrel Domain